MSIFANMPATGGFPDLSNINIDLSSVLPQSAVTAAKSVKPTTTTAAKPTVAKRKPSLATRAYLYKKQKALDDYKESIKAGVDPRAAAKTAQEATIAAEKEYVSTIAARMSRDYGKSLFEGAAGAAGMAGAGTLAGTGTAMNVVSGGVTTGVTPTTVREEITVPKAVASQKAPAQQKVQEAKQEQKKISEFIESEIKAQETLAPIRERRRRAAKQEASLLRRQTGRRALLASPAGGAGFFTGYFK